MTTTPPPAPAHQAILTFWNGLRPSNKLSSCPKCGTPQLEARAATARRGTNPPGYRAHIAGRANGSAQRFVFCPQCQTCQRVHYTYAPGEPDQLAEVYTALRARQGEAVSAEAPAEAAPVETTAALSTLAPLLSAALPMLQALARDTFVISRVTYLKARTVKAPGERRPLRDYTPAFDWAEEFGAKVLEQDERGAKVVLWNERRYSREETSNGQIRFCRRIGPETWETLIVFRPPTNRAPAPASEVEAEAF